MIVNTLHFCCFNFVLHTLSFIHDLSMHKFPCCDREYWLKCTLWWNKWKKKEFKPFMFAHAVYMVHNSWIKQAKDEKWTGGEERNSIELEKMHLIEKNIHNVSALLSTTANYTFVYALANKRDFFVCEFCALCYFM